MPNRRLISRELADLFGVLANPDRIRIIEELRGGELDVNGLQRALDIPQARVSQHLAVLRAHRIAAERREGRHVYYHLLQPQLAEWIVQGLEFFGGELSFGQQMRAAIDEVRALWSPVPDAGPEGVRRS
jgi:DNA-binding transcriptional ArsR family regulator